MSKTISILGCGWLGFPLAISLIAKGWAVKGSTTSVDKLKILDNNGIAPYLVQLSNIDTLIKSDFLNAGVLLINIPPSLKRQTGTDYLRQMEGLVAAIKTSAIRRVIFISSTSVYLEQGKEIDQVDENSVLLQSEALFTKCNQFKTSVIRFAGLIGAGRHPSRFFAGKKNIPNGDAPVNLIHLDDCIGVIEAVLNQDACNSVYAVAAPSHPSRKVFYTLAAQQAGLPLPEFMDELKEWKIVNPGKAVNELNYQFIHPDWIKWLERMQD